MQRRTLLRLGLGGAGLLTLAGGGLALLQPGWRQGRLSEPGRRVLGAVARSVLEGLLPVPEPARLAAMAGHFERLDATVAALAPHARAELSQLLALLHAAPGRLAMCGLKDDWAAASTADVGRALQVMRQSGLAIRQQAYHALRNLTNAAHFSDPSSWTALGYPGPRTLA